MDISREENGWRLRRIEGPGPYESSDPDTSRIFWSDGGVHQNLTFPVHPDPVRHALLAPGGTPGEGET